MKKVVSVFLALLFLCSCNRCLLTVQTNYVTHKDLASYYVNTPDPRQNVSAIGQRLIVGWVVPKQYLKYENLHLEVTIRFRNREEITEIFHILRTRGTYVYSLFNEDYLCKRGILTYKIAIVGGGCILEEWRHRIWVDLISIDQEAELAQDVGCGQVSSEDEYPIDWQDDNPL